MRTMVTLFSSLVAVAILASAALAQPAGPPPPCAAEPGDVIFLAGEPLPPDAIFVAAEEPATQNAPWLGIEVEPVPPPLAAHLATGPAGLMIHNIFKESPADKAGLDRHDVILEINGQKVTSDVGQFMQYVKHLNPSDSVKLVYIHGGARKEVSLQMARRPDRIEPKYPPEPYDFRGRIMRRGPEGWIVDDLGPIPAPGEWPKQLRRYADKLFDAPGPPPPGEPAEARRVTKEGEVLVVQRKHDGKIEVKRFTQEKGEKSAESKTYADLKELEAADRQAFDLLKDAEAGRLDMSAPPPSHVVSPELRERLGDIRKYYQDEMRQLEEAAKDLDHRTQDYQNALRDWRDRFGRSLGEAPWRDRWGQWRERFFQGPLEEMKPPASQPTAGTEPRPHHGPPPPPERRMPMPGPEALHGPGPHQPAPPPPPNVRFEAKPDGSITVYLRHKDAETSRSYPSEKTLKEQAPQLYQQYQELQKGFR